MIRFCFGKKSFAAGSEPKSCLKTFFPPLSAVWAGKAAWRLVPAPLPHPTAVPLMLWSLGTVQPLPAPGACPRKSWATRFLPRRELQCFLCFFLRSQARGFEGGQRGASSWIGSDLKKRGDLWDTGPNFAYSQLRCEAQQLRCVELMSLGAGQLRTGLGHPPSCSSGRNRAGGCTAARAMSWFLRYHFLVLQA